MKKVLTIGWAMLLALATISCGGDEKKTSIGKIESESAANKQEKVRVDTIRTEMIEREIERTSVLEGYETMNVSPSMTGIIEKIYKEVGDRVSTGELLVRMDQTQLKQAKLAFANLETEMKRMEALIAGGNTTQQQYDGVKFQYDQAKENLEFLQNNTFFKATFPGVVSAKNFEDGELFNGARAILTVTQINVLKTLISIPEAYFPRVKQGMKLELISDIYPDKKFPAVIETIYPTIDAATHTFQCKVRIPNGTNLLRPGMYVHTTVPVGKSEALLVPYQAVLKLTGSNERFLFINEGGYAKRIAVTLGDRFDTKIEVIAEEDLKGKELVVQGQNRLVDGIGLEIISDVQNVNASTDTLTSETKQDTIVK